MQKPFMLLVIGLFFGFGLGFLFVASNDVTLDGRDHERPGREGEGLLHARLRIELRTGRRRTLVQGQRAAGCGPVSLTALAASRAPGSLEHAVEREVLARRNRPGDLPRGLGTAVLADVHRPGARGALQLVELGRDHVRHDSLRTAVGDPEAV